MGVYLVCTRLFVMSPYVGKRIQLIAKGIIMLTTNIGFIF